jgi:ABC-type branched-subunit amino acid transport system substrate-binding protein
LPLELPACVGSPGPKEHQVIRIGGLGPLTLPGVPWAGRELQDGMSLAVQHLNDSGGVLGRQLTLLFEDTCGRPEAGVAAVEKLLGVGVHAIAGEFHSLVADRIVASLECYSRPFVCASATLDDITARRLDCVFRLAPAQSYGWAVYADFLASHGFRHVVALQEDNAYWNNGSTTIETRLRQLGVRFTRLSARPELVDAASWFRHLRQSDSPTPDILLLLVAYPEPLRSVISAAHHHGFVPPACFLGDPAGRTVFPDWWEVAGVDAIQVPFLSYMHPTQSTAKGRRLSLEFKKQYRREPTFVASEGYDSVLAIAGAFQNAGTTEAPAACDALRHMALEGTRGTISFSTEREGVVHQQWKWPPVCVAVYSHARQSFPEADILGHAENGQFIHARYLH